MSASIASDHPPRTTVQGYRPPRASFFWLVGFAIWTGLALLSFTQGTLAMGYRGVSVPWQQLLAWSFVDWYSCALFIPLFVLMVRRAPLERGSWRRRLPLYLIATIVASIAKYVLVTPIQQTIFGMQRTLVAVLATSAFSELMIFWAVLGALHAVLFYLRYREREAVELQLRAALSESQLQALRAQLHPHFLFNTLNAATALIHRDPDAADSMLTRLGELLRLTLRADPGHEIALRDELQVLERY